MLKFKNDWIKMSSRWKDDRMKPWNVFKTSNFNANWGQGEFTCIHTMNDEAGPWWSASFGRELSIGKVQILNRGDCCHKRLNDAKVFIGDKLCGKVSDAPKGDWVSVKCKGK
jgi:hypothetical protein